jgi:hypothetical protein
MKKNFLNEVNRMREIMGLNTILEQTDTRVRLFVSLLDEKSKIYWESAGSDFACSPKHYFKYRFPTNELKPDKLPESVTSKRGVEGQYLYSSYNYIPKSYFNDDSKYRSSAKELRNIEDQKGDRLGQVKTGFPLGEASINPDYNESALSTCSSGDYKAGEKVTGSQKRQSGAEVPPMTEEVKDGFIQYFTEWCTKKYPEKKDKNTPDMGECRKNIDKIKLNPGSLQTEKGSEGEPIPAVRFDANINRTTQGEPFPNNSTQVGQGVIDWVNGLIQNINQFKKTYPGGKVSVANKVTVDGSVQNYPFTILTSASRYRNTGQAEQMSFKQLSEERAQSVYDYIVNQLSSVVPDIGNTKVVLNSDGRNGDGSSGPNPPSPNKFSMEGGEPNSFKDSGERTFNNMEPHTSPNEYEQYKFCIIQLAIEFNYNEDDESLPVPPSSLGEWGIKIISKTGGDGGGRNIIIIRKIKEGGGNIFKDSGGITCAAYD